MPTRDRELDHNRAAVPIDRFWFVCDWHRILEIHVIALLIVASFACGIELHAIGFYALLSSFVQQYNSKRCKRPVTLSITHKVSTDGCPQFDISETGQASPHDQVAGWRIGSTSEIAPELCHLG